MKYAQNEMMVMAQRYFHWKILPGANPFTPVSAASSRELVSMLMSDMVPHAKKKWIENQFQKASFGLSKTRKDIKWISNMLKCDILFLLQRSVIPKNIKQWP